MGNYICSECGEENEGQLLDFGIGSYEYFGSRGFHSDVQFVSTCCEADLLDDTGKPASPPDWGGADEDI